MREALERYPDLAPVIPCEAFEPVSVNKEDIVDELHELHRVLRNGRPQLGDDVTGAAAAHKLAR